MKISRNWLAEFVELPASIDELSRKLTFSGLEVEAIHRPGEGLGGVVVAKILESVQHPNADKLSVTKVDAGGPEPLQIVCGAKNYKVGDHVPLATVGAKLPGGMEIKKAKLRGVESSGMLCSARELGLSEDAAGLMILPHDSKPGTPIDKALGLDDVILELNVTPNRPDALSHLGVARDVAALMGKTAQIPPENLIEGGGATDSKVKLRIEDPKGCPRYAARIVEGIKIGPSPQWLQRRLEACGVRAINNVVDVTNFVNLELGQPLHAFDLDKLAGPEIVVRRARPGEKLKTLDGKERALDPDDLVIADRDRAQALAGTMGGEPTEVTAGTTRILLESACFEPSSVRRMSKRHGIHSEASHRFERGSDIGIVPVALGRAAALIAELGGGRVLEGRVDVYPAEKPRRSVTLRFDRLSAVLGVTVPPEEIRRILGALGFEASGEGGRGMQRYLVPTSRVDVEIEEDLIEEVARIRGYDQIPEALPRGLSQLAPEPKEAEVERRIRSAVAGLGYDEVLNYSFVSPRELQWTHPGPLDRLGESPDAIRLENPLSAEMSVMRTSLYPGLLQNLSRNLRHQLQTVKLYELGNVFTPNPQGGRDGASVATERMQLGGLAWGRREGRTWAAPDVAMDFFDAKGGVEAVLSALGISRVSFVAIEEAPLHPRATAEVRIDGRRAGVVGELHPKTARALDLPAGVYVFQLDVAALQQAAVIRPEYASIPKYPAVLRDLAVVVPAELPNEEVRNVIREVGGPLVQDAKVFDVYTGKPIPEGKKNLAYAITYRSAERTLTDEEVSQAHARIVEEVNRRLGGSLRGANP